MYRIIRHGDDARQPMLKGIDTIADLVKNTMGVKGKNIVLDTHPYANPTYTNDGVTIAQELIIKDRFENVGAKLIREVAAKTADNAGDGTTTAMVLMQAIVHEGIKAMASGYDALGIRDEIRASVKQIVEQIEKEKVVATDKQTLAATATISCRDAELGDMIADIVMQAKADGMITLEDSFEPTTTYEQLEGLRLRGGIIHDMFINQNETKQAVFKDALVVVTNQQVTTVDEAVAIMEAVNMAGKKEAILIAAGIEGDALANIAVNWQKKTMQVLPVRVLAYGDLGEGMLKDVAAISGATYFDNTKSIQEITTKDFGTIAKIVSDKHETTVISDSNELKMARIKELKLDQKTAREFELENIKERIAKLSSSMFTIKVGGVTESERKEVKTRVDDAVKAARAAFIDGVVAGGGSALYRAAQNLDSYMMQNACEAPIRQLALNSAIELDRGDLKAILNKKKAIDFNNGNVVEAFTEGIIDPLKVVTESITNAAAGAISFLMTEGAVVLEEPPKEERI